MVKQGAKKLNEKFFKENFLKSAVFKKNFYECTYKFFQTYFRALRQYFKVRIIQLRKENFEDFGKTLLKLKISKIVKRSCWNC